MALQRDVQVFFINFALRFTITSLLFTINSKY